MMPKVKLFSVTAIIIALTAVMGFMSGATWQKRIDHYACYARAYEIHQYVKIREAMHVDLLLWLCEHK